MSWFKTARDIYFPWGVGLNQLMVSWYPFLNVPVGCLLLWWWLAPALGDCSGLLPKMFLTWALVVHYVIIVSNTWASRTVLRCSWFCTVDCFLEIRAFIVLSCASLVHCEPVFSGLHRATSHWMSPVDETWLSHSQFPKEDTIPYIRTVRYDSLTYFTTCARIIWNRMESVHG